MMNLFYFARRKRVLDENKSGKIEPDLHLPACVVPTGQLYT